MRSCPQLESDPSPSGRVSPGVSRRSLCTSPGSPSHSHCSPAAREQSCSETGSAQSSSAEAATDTKRGAIAVSR